MRREEVRTPAQRELHETEGIGSTSTTSSLGLTSRWRSKNCISRYSRDVFTEDVAHRVEKRASSISCAGAILSYLAHTKAISDKGMQRVRMPAHVTQGILTISGIRDRS
jgi:hypothetical protein